MSNQPHHLFVYGTLRSDIPRSRARLLDSAARCVGRGRTRGRLYDLGFYPCMTPAEGDETVLGEVYELTDDTLLDRLDQYEGCDEGLYRRVEIIVDLDGGHGIAAWSYRFDQPLPAKARLVESGDYAACKSCI